MHSRETLFAIAAMWLFTWEADKLYMPAIRRHIRQGELRRGAPPTARLFPFAGCYKGVTITCQLSINFSKEKAALAGLVEGSF